MTDDCPVEIRADADDATLGDIFIADQPVGVLLDNAREEAKRARKRVAELEAEKEQLGDRLAELEHRLDGMEDRTEAVEDTIYADGKQGKVRNLIEFAENKRESGQQAVVLTPQEIRGAAGCTRRYAYDIIDEFSDDYGFFVDRQHLTQYGELEMTNREDRGRGLAVIFDGSVHKDVESVNRFTTRTAAEGGEP